jgi:hypothetical protein
MAVPTNTLLTFSAVGNREDLARQDHQHLADRRSVHRGDGGTVDRQRDLPRMADGHSSPPPPAMRSSRATTSPSPLAADTVRVGNRTQISRKEVIVSGTQEAVDKAGRNSESSIR